MHKGVARLIASTVAGVSLASAMPAIAQNRIFYVDYQSGSDAADGLSPGTAWKHAPGDAQATGVVKKQKLQPGDHVRFRGGVRYRGSISPSVTGTEENPIVYDGSSWGTTRAIIDGSNSLDGVRACTSAADCLGSPHWRNLFRASLPSTAKWTDYLFVNDLVFQLGQYPSLSKLDADDAHLYLPIPKAELDQLKAGQIRHAMPAGFAKGNPVLALWVDPNLIALTEDVQVSATGVNINGDAKWVNAGFKPYANRDNMFSLMNLPDQVNRPGLFAMSPNDGVAIFWPMPPSLTTPSHAISSPAVSIGGRRGGITTSLASHLVIRGFSFTSFAGVPGNLSAGAVIRGNGANPGISILNNQIRSVVNIGGPAAIYMVRSQKLRIENNKLVDAPWSRGIVIDSSRGPSMIRCNDLAEIGNTAIRVLNVMDSRILGNKLARIQSRHGNGITAYMDLRNVQIAGNVVTDTTRPLTVHGLVNGAKPYFDEGTPSVTITDNVLMGGDGVNGAITSYGSTQNLVISGNFLYSIPNAMKLAGTETGFVATNNQMVGKVAQPKATPVFTAGTTNVFHAADGNGALLAQQMQRSKPPAGYCS